MFPVGIATVIQRVIGVDQGYTDAHVQPDARPSVQGRTKRRPRLCILVVDMKNEVFAVSAYNVITWHDARLEWDPKDLG